MIEVLSAGLYTSIQDLGRFGYRKLGIPLSGAMDQYSAQLANQLLGNSHNSSVLEITLTGPVLRFNTEMQIAITGAGFAPTLNNSEVPLNTRIKVPAKSTLKFGLASYGLRAYLSVPGGFDSEEVLRSASFYPGITSKLMIEKGNRLRAKSLKQQLVRASASVKEDIRHFTTKWIDATKGPEFDVLPSAIQKQLFETDFIVKPESNRMAYILENSTEFSAKDIITTPVQPGTIQLTPSGKIVVLMRDAQTTGGYARILQLSENSINQLAQKRAGAIFRFKIV